MRGVREGRENRVLEGRMVDDVKEGGGETGGKIGEAEPDDYGNEIYG